MFREVSVVGAREGRLASGTKEKKKGQSYRVLLSDEVG